MNEKQNSVLIVDDEPMNIKALIHILSQEYTVFAETDGAAVMAAAKRLKPDLILLDIIMPGLDGFGVIEQLKTDPETREIPVIFVTGLDSAQDEVKGFLLGAADYINKPFSPPVVEMRVRHQIKIVNQMRKIHSLSVTCILTGIGNRRYFNEQLAGEWERAKRSQSPVSFIIMDVDDFKTFNDTHGHFNGDIALQAVAKSITEELTRATDIAARWGGEEFTVILPDTALEGAKIVAENIRSAIEKNRFTLLDETTKANVTVSMGVHFTIPEYGGQYSLQNFISDTDNALFKAKLSGKNQIAQFSK